MKILKTVLFGLLGHFVQTPGQECCGLLAGRDGVITHVFPATNVARDPARNYEIDPRETVRLMREFRQQKLEFLGIYHSHPNGKDKPSEHDIELAYYSEAIYFIIAGKTEDVTSVSAFSIRDGRAERLEIEML
ncbi:MAG TPA: M67 family metallopeptidase [Candidatus Aquilonibacter sp.]|nr:M67 family metallopeptidase [Candidatus Aquilonibacter sp.]